MEDPVFRWSISRDRTTWYGYVPQVANTFEVVDMNRFCATVWAREPFGSEVSVGQLGPTHTHVVDHRPLLHTGLPSGGAKNCFMRS